ncbi:MAG: hypothetical protein NC548_35175 [Lachnospiraceae bacterium]|nr:hypothetical protein [Lachnospiraceae bacterium]
MADNTQKNYSDQIRQHMMDAARLKEQNMRDCDHKANNRGRVMGLHDSKVKYPGKDKMPPSTAVCTRCERVFESESYTKDENASALYQLQSIAEQIKLNANLSDQDKNDIAEYYAALDVVSGMLTYYNNMVEKMASGGGNKQKKASNKGHMGLNSDMFGGRGF